MNQPTTDLVNQHVADNPSATFFELLDVVLNHGYKLTPQWEIINDETMLEQIVNDLVEYHDYSKSEARKAAPDFTESVVNSMWDQYSYTLSELTAGY